MLYIVESRILEEVNTKLSYTKYSQINNILVYVHIVKPNTQTLKQFVTNLGGKPRVGEETSAYSLVRSPTCPYIISQFFLITFRW